MLPEVPFLLANPMAEQKHLDLEDVHSSPEMTPHFYSPPHDDSNKSSSKFFFLKKAQINGVVVLVTTL